MVEVITISRFKNTCTPFHRKITVNDDTRSGLFTVMDVKMETHLTQVSELGGFAKKTTETGKKKTGAVCFPVVYIALSSPRFVQS